MLILDLVGYTIVTSERMNACCLTLTDSRTVITRGVLLEYRFLRARTRPEYAVKFGYFYLLLYIGLRVITRKSFIGGIENICGMRVYLSVSTCTFL